MGLSYCERCRFSFEASESPACCPQCGEEGVPAERAQHAGESSVTIELRVVAPPDGE